MSSILVWLPAPLVSIRYLPATIKVGVPDTFAERARASACLTANRHQKNHRRYRTAQGRHRYLRTNHEVPAGRPVVFAARA